MRVLIRDRKPVPELRCNHCAALIARYELDPSGEILTSPLLPATIDLSASGLLPCPSCGQETDISVANFGLNWYHWVISNTRVEPTFI